ncbi:MAG: amidase [Pseudomonadota bacterium]
MSSEVDDVGAFTQRVDVAPTGSGPLDGLTFAAKDIFDIAGHVTGGGSLDWARTHPTAGRHAAPVAALLAAGARCVAKAVSDEMAFSLMGENPAWGTPRNTADPRRVPGGSSSGSAAAVAAGLVDFALGSDTGGSVRAPASFCGIWGIRPTHGAIPLDGTMPFAPSFDMPGWFAREATVLAKVGRALGLDAAAPMPERLLLPVDAWTVASAETVAALAPTLARLEVLIGPATPIRLALDSLDDWRDCFRVCQCAEGWATHGDWIEETHPKLAPNVAARFDYAATISATDWAAARDIREGIRARLSEVLPAGCVAVLPTCPGPAPFRGQPDAATDAYRNDAHRLLCPAGHGGLPQISMPAGSVDGGPVGLSLLARTGADATLLSLAIALQTTCA